MDIRLPGTPPTGDDQQLWRETLETLAQLKTKIEALESRLNGR